MKDFALTSEEFVRDAEASHGFEMQRDDGVGDDSGDFGFFAAIFFNGFEGAGAKFGGVRFVLFQKVGDFGVEIPAVIIEPWVHREHLYAHRRSAFHVQETNNDVSDLNAGVVNVVLDLDGVSGVAKNARHSVAQDGVAEMANVCGFVGVDAGVLDDHLSGYFR